MKKSLEACEDGVENLVLTRKDIGMNTVGLMVNSV